MSSEGGTRYELSLAEQRLCADLPKALRLAWNERITVGHAWNTVSVEVLRHKAPPVVIAQPWMATALAVDRRRAIGRAIGDALDELALHRAWKFLGTDGPPASLLRTNELWDALTGTGRIGSQDLVDRVHRKIRDPDAEVVDPNAPIGWWRHASTMPTPVSGIRGLEAHHDVERHGTEPWIAGRMIGNGIGITACARDDTFAIRMSRNTRGARRPRSTYEIRTTRLVPETLAHGCVGREVTSVVDEDVVRCLGGTIIAVTQTPRLLCFRVRIDKRPRPTVLEEHLAEYRFQRDELDQRREAVTDALERAFR